MGHTLLFGGIEMLAGAYKPAAQIHPQLVPLGFTDEDELQSDPFDSSNGGMTSSSSRNEQ